MINQTQKIDYSEPSNLGKKVLVTGANGHLGYTLTKILVESGYSVRASVRDHTNPSKIKKLKNLDIEIVSLDITDEQQFIKVAKGMDGIFHIAAVFKFGLKDPEQSIIQPNIMGAKHAIKAAKHNGIKRVVYTSSTVAILSKKSTGEHITESDWNTKTKIPYQVAKTRAEREAWKLAISYGVDLVAINPGFILGPNFDKKSISSSINVFDEIKKGKIPVIPPFGFNMVDVRDVAEAHIQAYQRKNAIGRYITAIKEPVTMEDLMKISNTIDPSIKVPKRKVNRFFFILYAAVISSIAKIVRKTPLISTQQAREYTDVLRNFDNSKIKQQLGIKFRPLEVSIADTLKCLDE